MAPQQPSAELLEHAAMLRQAYDQCALPHFRKLEEPDIRSKGFRDTATDNEEDVATIADTKVEEFVVGWFAERGSKARVVGEEMVDTAPEILKNLDKGEIVILDPIDGSSPFRAGKTGHGILMSRQKDGKTYEGYILRTFDTRDGGVDTEIIMGDAKSGVWHSPGAGQPFVRLEPDAPEEAPAIIHGLVTAKYTERGLMRNEDAIYARLKDTGHSMTDPAMGLHIEQAGTAVNIYANLVLRRNNVTGKRLDFIESTPTRPWDNSAGNFLNRLRGGSDAQMDTGLPYDPTRLDGGVVAASSPAVLKAARERLFVGGEAPMGREPCVWGLLLKPSQERYQAAGLATPKGFVQTPAP